jgi:dienelactone hydrolase
VITVRRLVTFSLALIGLPVFLLWRISERALHPRPRPEDHSLEDFALPVEEVSFLSRDGTLLAGWFIPPLAARAPGIVLSHGHGRSRLELLPHADFLHHAGFAVLAFDYRYRGASGGAAVTMGLREQDDLRAAIDYLAARQEVDRARIGVLGMSMGAVVAILVAARDERVRAVVAECPYSGHEAIMTRALRHYFRLPSFPLAPLAHRLIEWRLGERLDVPRAVDRVGEIAPRPIFVIADERDAVIGWDESKRVFDAARGPKRFWLVPGADHACGWQAAGEEYERRVLAFLGEALGVATPTSSARGPS